MLLIGRFSSDLFPGKDFRSKMSQMLDIGRETKSFRYPNVVEYTIWGMKHSETIKSPKSSEAGVPSGAGANALSWSMTSTSPSSQARMASAATMSTRSQVTLPA